MRIGGKEVIPPFEFWIPDYADFTIPHKSNGLPYKYPEDFESYLEWLVDYIDAHDFPLSPQHSEIARDPIFQDFISERLGLWLGGASISGYYWWFTPPSFDYPEDFLHNPDPERVCDPNTVKWDDELLDAEGEVQKGMIDLQTFMIIDCLSYRANQLYKTKSAQLPPGSFIGNDIGWRPLLKICLAKAKTQKEKIRALKFFHDEFSYLSMK